MATKLVKKKFTPVRVKEGDGQVKVIGNYDEDRKIFYCTRKKSEHFMRKHNAWGLDLKTVQFLAKNNATIRLKDTEGKWEYECKASEIVFRGIEEEHKDHRPQLFLKVDYWDVLRAKDRTSVIKCGDIGCTHNFAKNCLRGSIEINDEGVCANYESK